MNSDDRDGTACLHVSELLPWYVNGTISDVEKCSVETHLTHCTACRDDLAIDQLMYKGMKAETAVEYLPAASLKKLQTRLDAIAMYPKEGRAASGSDRAYVQWPKLLAASIAVMALAISLLVIDRWTEFRAGKIARYHTVTNPTPQVSGVVIRAVFSKAITLAKMQAILDESSLQIVSGPTEAGVYSLASPSGRPLGFSLSILRANPQVLFAESVPASVLSRDSP